ncbi:MAG: tetratricopeptide repeat protein [Pirellulales bacterium]|nr:tetratricopeptide repeat protein [Pirellulales bacterium]
MKRVGCPLLGPITVSLGLALLSGCQALSSKASVLPKPASLGINHSTASRRKIDKQLDQPVNKEQSAQACIAAAREFKRQGHEADAIAMFERARQHQHDVRGLSRDLATLYDRSGEYFKAQREYEAALQETPRNSELLNDFGFFHYQRGQFTQAETRLRQALEIAPTNERARTNLGMTLVKLGRVEEAEQEFAMASGPAAAAYNVATLLAKAGDVRQATHRCEKALRLQPTLEPAQQLLTSLTSPTSQLAHQLANASGPPASNPQGTASR